MRICSLILILAVAAASVGAEPKFDAAATAKALAPFVDESTLIVVRLDLQNADSDALVKLLGPLALTPEAKKYLSTCKEWLTEYRKLGGKEIYSIYGASDFPNIPLLLTPTTADEPQRHQLIQSLQYVFGEKDTSSIYLNGFLCVGSPAALAALKTKKPVARQEIEEALTACGAGLAQVVITPSAQARKIFEELSPTLPKELGGGSITTYTRDMKWLALGVGHTPKATIRLLIQTTSADAAGQIGGTLEKIFPHIAKELPQDDDNPEAEGVRKLVGMLQGLIKPMVSGADKNRLVIATDLEMQIPEIAKLANDAKFGSKAKSLNNLRELGTACLKYESKHRRYPANIRDKTGKPILSWRVAILPYFGEQELYKQFHLDEPWNSDHNGKLLAQMPRIYLSPLQNIKRKDRTTYLAPLGKGLAWDDPEGTPITSILDGTSQTILLVEADDEHGVPWTKPDDMEIDPKNPTKGLMGHFKTSFAALFCDGHVLMLKKNYQGLNALFTRASSD